MYMYIHVENKNNHIHTCIRTSMHFLCIVYGEYVDGGHLEKTCGVTCSQLTLPGPVDQPELEEAITRTFKQLNAAQENYSGL